MKHARKTLKEDVSARKIAFRTAIMPVALRSSDYQRAHNASQKSALLWNELVKFQKNHWKTVKREPGIQLLRDHVCSLDPA
jgi:hypothetical protein